MSWMSEISIIIEDARAYGVTLELGDFRRLGNRLMINGEDADDWFARLCNAVDRLEDLES